MRQLNLMAYVESDYFEYINDTKNTSKYVSCVGKVLFQGQIRSNLKFIHYKD